MRIQDVLYNEHGGEIIDDEGYRIEIERQTLDGLSIGYGWSANYSIFHFRINHMQIDNQLQCSMFPVAFHPVISKIKSNDIRRFLFFLLNRIFQKKRSF